MLYILPFETSMCPLLIITEALSEEMHDNRISICKCKHILLLPSQTCMCVLRLQITPVTQPPESQSTRLNVCLQKAPVNQRKTEKPRSFAVRKMLGFVLAQRCIKDEDTGSVLGDMVDFILSSRRRQRYEAIYIYVRVVRSQKQITVRTKIATEV